MKKALAILAVAGLVASMYSTSDAAIKTRNVGTFAVRTAIYNTDTPAGDTYGDVTSWNTGNNANQGTLYAGGWSAAVAGTGNAAVTIVHYDRTELQSLVDAVPVGSPLAATMLIGNRNAAQGTWNGNMVIGLFKADNTSVGNNMWIADTNTINAPKFTKMGYDAAGTTYSWRGADGQDYSNFYQMVNQPANGLFSTNLGATTLGRIDYNSVPITDPTWAAALNISGEKVNFPMALVTAYLSDPSWSGFFISCAADGLLQGYPGNQWGGAPSPGIMITPEPATMVLLALGGLALIRRRNA